MTTRLAVLMAVAPIAASATAPMPPRQANAPPRRIVSLTLCADQLVLALADRGQIAGLSRYATDSALSAAAKKARGFPVLRDAAESLVVAKPDMVVAIPDVHVGAVDALGGSVRRIATSGANSYPEILRDLRQIGAAAGHPERAEALIRIMDARLAKVPRSVGRGKVAAYYQRRGYMTGTGTLVDDLMHRLGLVNLAAKLGKPPLSQLSLEELVAVKPDYLILESATADITDQGTEMLHHPALRDIPKLWVPEAWTVCGTPEYVLAAESLARQLARTRR